MCQHVSIWSTASPATALARPGTEDGVLAFVVCSNQPMVIGWQDLTYQRH